MLLTELDRLLRIVELFKRLNDSFYFAKIIQLKTPSAQDLGLDGWCTRKLAKAIALDIWRGPSSKDLFV